MAPPTLSKRIKEIITLTRGNRSQAERMIRETIARDPHFLRELVEPFLPGIIAHALARAAEPAAGAGPAAPLPAGGMDALLRGLEENAALPRHTGHAHPGSGHADTIRALAEAQRKRRSST